MLLTWLLTKAMVRAVIANCMQGVANVLLMDCQCVADVATDQGDGEGCDCKLYCHQL